MPYTVEFYSSSSTWGNDITHPTYAFTSTEETQILDALAYIYANSAYAASILDSANTSIRIGKSLDDSRTFHAVPYSQIDRTQELLWINDQGIAVKSDPLLILFHEIYHQVTGDGDLALAVPTVSDENALGWDFMGPTVLATNIVADQLGLSDHNLISYTMQREPLDANEFWVWEENRSYSYWNPIDTARRGTSAGDDIHMEQRGTSADLIFGFGGSDTITAGDGPDYVYGDFPERWGPGGAPSGSGADKLYLGGGYNFGFGGDEDDLIVGGDDGNFINGGSGNDQLIGGTGDDNIQGDDVTAAAEGNDIIIGGDGSDGIDGGGGEDIIVSGSDGKHDFVNGGNGSDQIFLGGPGNFSGWYGDDHLIISAFNPAQASGNVVNLEGGTGSDTFWFEKNSQSLDIYIGDSDPGDRIVWNGYELGDFTAYNVDQDPVTDEVWRANANEIGAAMKVITHYTYDLEDNLISVVDWLYLFMPDNTLLKVADWSNGDMGITLVGPDVWSSAGWTQTKAYYDANLPYLSTYNDGVVQDVSGISHENKLIFSSEAQTAVSTFGGLAAPEFFV